VLFDGVCNLCNVTVDFLLRRDRQGRLRFAPLQSEVGRELLRYHGLEGVPVPDSVVLIEEGRALLRSSAVLELCRHLGWPWRWLGALRVVPRGVADRLYDWVARNRYGWFGRRAACRQPSPEQRERFLD
jgi:predicted DCC family thiol-disulfide oxidoreductase YuxK